MTRNLKRLMEFGAINVYVLLFGAIEVYVVLLLFGAIGDVLLLLLFLDMYIVNL